jgi:hypothetical protein
MTPHWWSMRPGPARQAAKAADAERRKARETIPKEPINVMRDRIYKLLEKGEEILRKQHGNNSGP